MHGSMGSDAALEERLLEEEEEGLLAEGPPAGDPQHGQLTEVCLPEPEAELPPVPPDDFDDDGFDDDDDLGELPPPMPVASGVCLLPAL